MIRIALNIQALTDLLPLLNSNEAEMKSIFDALDAVGVSPSLREIDAQLSIKADDEKISRVANAFAYLIYEFYRLPDKPLSVHEFAEEICRQLLLRAQSDSVSLELLKPYLVRTLNAESDFGISLKSNDLLTQHDKNYLQSRIFTDLRPLFHTDSISDPIAFVMMHTLRIRHQTDVSQAFTFTVAMDTTELYELKNCVDRSLDKAEKLRLFVAQKGAVVIETNYASSEDERSES